MLTDYPSESSESEEYSPLCIQDVIIHGEYMQGQSVPIGEYGKADADEKTQVPRLYETIEGLVVDAGFKHKYDTCGGSEDFKPGKENTITRLMSNEFSFYTKTPLSMDNFSDLMSKIDNLAKEQPENLQLILSSFAVKTPENKIMNVVAQIDCGKNPEMNFMVKNNPSNIDPVYSERKESRRVTYPNVDIRNGDTVDHLQVNVNGQEKPFSFNNLSIRQTAGGAKYISAVDICYDHFMAVGKNNLTSMIAQRTEDVKNGTEDDFIPLQSTQALTSNTASIIFDNTFSVVSHADPYYSKVGPVRWGEDILEPQQVMSKVSFGDQLKATYTDPRELMLLPKEIAKDVKSYNFMLSQELGVPIPATSLPHLLTQPPQPQLTGSEQAHKNTEDLAQSAIQLGHSSQSQFLISQGKPDNPSSTKPFSFSANSQTERNSATVSNEESQPSTKQKNK